jgi:hypothetical protein
MLAGWSFRLRHPLGLRADRAAATIRSRSGHRRADLGSWSRPPRRFLEAPSYRVQQKLAFPSVDRLSASFEIPVRAGKCTLQLSDAIDEKAYVGMRQIHWTVRVSHSPSLQPGRLN